MKHYLRNAIRLGTSLTALFLLVRCGVPERDYSKLGIGNTDNGGSSGAGDVLHSSAGQAGIGGEGGSSGSAGNDGLGDAGSDQGGSAGAPPAPIPCNPVVNDAGSEDAGASDAGTVDAGTVDAGSEDAGADDSASLCACVNGFIRAVDTDGDGDGTRACSAAPGLDCDDNDPLVTHNACGGCTVLPNAIGDDCGDCGSYACDGPDGVKCVSKPGPVEDPDCRCAAGLIVARDTDGDGAGTRLCEQNPGIDCNDGNGSLITNECGGCADLPAAVGDACNECGAYVCYNNGSLGTGSNGTLRCGPAPAAVSTCNDTINRHSCNANGFWSDDNCEFACYNGNCEACLPGTFRCIYNAAGDTIEACFDSVSYGINWWYASSCLIPGSLRCDPATGGCTSGSLLLPRDRSFEIVPSQRDGLPWHDLLNTALDSEYG